MEQSRQLAVAIAISLIKLGRPISELATILETTPKAHGYTEEATDEVVYFGEPNYWGTIVRPFEFPDPKALSEILEILGRS
jgi:hypothetical protein